MTRSLLKPMLLTASLLLATGLALEAQEPKPTPAEVKPTPAETKPVPKDTKAAPKDTKAAPKDTKTPAKPSTKRPAPVGPNYMVGDTPPAKTPAPKPPKPKYKSKGKPEKLPYEKRVDINKATKDELKKLPGVTEEYAVKIIAKRPYNTKTILMTKEIIPSTVYFLIKDQIAVGSGTSK